MIKKAKSKNLKTEVIQIIKKAKIKNKEKKSTKLPADKLKITPKEYKSVINGLKENIHLSRLRTSLKINEELMRLFWEIGKEIVELEENQQWEAERIECLAKDLQNSFPDNLCFSKTNILRMKSFYLAYQQVSQLVRQLDNLPIFQLPWGHNIILIEMLNSAEQRIWFAEQTLIHGWSSETLEREIKSQTTKSPTIFKKNY